MKKTAILIAIIFLIVSLFSGCDELFDANMITERDPFIPTSGTPVPEPNAPLLKTQEPMNAPETTETPFPITSTNPKPAPSPQPTSTLTPTIAPTVIPTAVPTSEPILTPTSEPTPLPPPEPTLIPPVVLIPKVGILTDDSDNTAYELSFMAWSGLEKAALDFGYEPVFMELPSMDNGTILAHIDMMVNEECELIVLPGYRFKSALAKAQLLYSDIYFIMIESDDIMNDNVTAIVFDEVQAGFLAGVAAAIELSASLGYETIDFGIIIGEDSLSIQNYSEGFQQGLTYVEMIHGIGVRLEQHFITYLEVLNDPEGAMYTAYGLYDSGVECILNLAGTSAAGVIQGAIDASGWEIPAYILAVDYDQYTEGIIDGQTSVVLTSAVKNYGTAVYNMISAYASGTFPGGTSILFNLANGGVGLPMSNPNLSSATATIINEVTELINNGMISLSPLAILSTPPIPAPSTAPPLPSTIPTIPPMP